MLAFMWQDDLIGVAEFVSACILKMSRWKAHRKVAFETLNIGKRKETAFKQWLMVGCVA